MGLSGDKEERALSVHAQELQAVAQQFSIPQKHVLEDLDGEHGS